MKLSNTQKILYPVLAMLALPILMPLGLLGGVLYFCFLVYKETLSQVFDLVKHFKPKKIHKRQRRDLVAEAYSVHEN
jgi:hypothetical protein